MKRIETIKDSKSFNDIIKNGKFIKNNYFVIYYKDNESENNKLGIAISNKIGKAHIRNRLKRQTRAIIDEYRNMFKNNFNYIIMIRKTCKEAEFTNMNQALKSLLEK
jgi:ribonuclease P protein component